IHGPMPGDPYAAPAPARPYRDEVGGACRGLRIGLMTSLPGGGTPHAECIKAVERAGEGLQQGAHHIEFSHPTALDENVEATRYFMMLVTCWVRAALDEWSAE